jgi:hypothetical protein
LVVHQSGVCSGDDKQPPFTVATKRNDDRVEVTVEQGKAIFTVHSPFGISDAVIERQEANWPDAVVLRLRLKGLERFRITNGKTTLDASVSQRDGTFQRRIWAGGKEDRPLESTSQNWFDIRILGEDGSPAKALPMNGGYFELRLPKGIMDGNPQSITVNWVDFYRN